MAAVAPRPVADAAAALTRNLDTARSLLSEPDATVPAMISAGGTPESRPPWNSSAAHAWSAARDGARALEAELRMRVTGSVFARGGSDGNTNRALEMIARFAEHDSLTRHDAGIDRRRCGCDECGILRQLNSFSNGIMALPAVDEVIRWQPVRSGPRPACENCRGTRACEAHGRPPACPYCETFSLRAARDRYLVACFNEACEDENGNPPCGRLETSRVNGEPLLVWDDGRIQSAA